MSEIVLRTEEITVIIKETDYIFQEKQHKMKDSKII